jgi:hypothetical protein
VIACREDTDIDTLSQSPAKNKLQQAVKQAVEVVWDEEADEEKWTTNQDVTANYVTLLGTAEEAAADQSAQKAAAAAPTSVKVGTVYWWKALT